MNQRKKKILISLIFVLVVTLLVGTQTFAIKTNYHPTLGKPLFLLERQYPIYSPFKILTWFQYSYSAPLALEEAKSNMIATFFIFFFFMVLIFRKKKKVDIHGSSTWATKEEIDKMGFFLIKQRLIRKNMNIQEFLIYTKKKYTK